MPKNWRFNALLSLGLIALSAYFLVPTFFHFDQIREKAEQSGTQPPFFLKLFPEKTIKLGLDLRGGIYVEVEVALEDAVNNRSDIIATEIERLTEKEPFIPEKVARLADSSQIKVTFKNAESKDAFRKWVRNNYHQALVEKESPTDDVLLFDLADTLKEQTRNLAARQALETIRNRIDRYGVSEPSIVRLGSNRIAIELPGMTDSERALSLIKKSGRLEFKLIDEEIPDEKVRAFVQEARNSLTLPDDFSEENVVKINTALKGKIPEEDEIAFEVQYDPVTRKTVGGVPYLLKKKAEITGDMLKNVQVNVQNNEPYVSLSLNPYGSRLFADLTKANIGKRLAILLDGNVSKAPVIKSEIPNGEAQITLGFGDYQSLLRESEDLTLVLREGALPARVHELSKTVIGPSLGQDSIQKGIKVSLLAGLLIILFMGFYYRISGVFADIALVLNLVLVLAALALFQATLTLPGIAGLVLTIGMAVDANVLIFERMREELRDGKSARNALKEGYQNAMSAIMDSNITTLLAGIVLYQFGTGPIRGFAVTLMIGIVTTVFTGLVVTRVLQEWMLFGLKRDHLSV